MTTSITWIKLYTETLDDPKIARLDDHLYRRFMEVLMLAGKRNQDGLLPPIDEMAWTLRADETILSNELQQFQDLGFVSLTDNGWIVVNYSKRQAPSDSAERMRRYRKRNKSLRSDVTGDAPETEEDTDTEVDTDVTRNGALQQLLEQVVGLPFNPSDIKGLHELYQLQIIESDIRGALAWRRENELPPIKRLNQLFPGIKTERNKRIQDGSARKYQPKEDEAWKARFSTV